MKENIENNFIENKSNPDKVLEYIKEKENINNNILEEGSNILKKIKDMNNEINQELKKQNIMLENLNIKMINNENKINKNSQELENIIKTTSSIKLFIIMIIQIVIIIFIILI